MSPIQMEDLETNFIDLDASATLGEAHRELRQTAGAWYVVVRLPEGQFAVLAATDLKQVLEDQGARARGIPLQDVESVVPFQSVERGELDIDEALPLMRLSYGRRLVVLENGKPVGLLVDREMGLSGDILVKTIKINCEDFNHPNELEFFPEESPDCQISDPYPHPIWH